MPGTRRARERTRFHECCVTGYSFLQTLSREELRDLAEAVPGGPSTRFLADLARRLGIVVLAGLLEDDSGRIQQDVRGQLGRRASSRGTGRSTRS